LGPLGVCGEEIPVVVQVADIEELVAREAVAAPELQVGLDVVEFAEAGGK
jgi:hypothetical protein